MTCSEISNLLPEYSIDMLDARETSLVQQHLATGCEACQCAVDEFRVALTSLGDDLQPVTPPPEVKQGLLDRLATEPQQLEADARDTGGVPFSPPAAPVAPNAELAVDDHHAAGPSLLRRMVPYAVAASVAFVAGWVLHSPEVPSEALNQRKAAYEAYMARMLQSFDRKEIQLANFSRSVASLETFGAVVLDGLANQVHLMYRPPQPTEEGSTLFAWARLDDARHVAIGSLSPNESGQISAAISIPPLPSDLRSIVVTSEPLDSLREPGDIAEPQGAEQVIATFAK